MAGKGAGGEALSGLGLMECTIMASECERKNQMGRRLHHVGILVFDPAPLTELLVLLRWKSLGETYNEEYGVRTYFVTNGEIQIEFIVPEKNESLKRQLFKRGNHIHHLALEVEDVKNAVRDLEKEGYQFIRAGAEFGYENRRISFLDPLSSKGILVELIEKG